MAEGSFWVTAGESASLADDSEERPARRLRGIGRKLLMTWGDIIVVGIGKLVMNLASLDLHPEVDRHAL